MKQYDHIFFDLDHTLWDYEVNSRLALNDLYDTHELENLGVDSKDDFYQNFSRINESLWPLYNMGKITSLELRENRFKMIFAKYGIEDHAIVPLISSTYLRECPLKPAVIPYTFEVLEYLKPRYTLDIITNGFNEIQMTKLKSSGLEPYFNNIITSERAGFKKPNRGIFEYAMQIINADKSRCIMIGDNLEADIQGARNANIDHVYFNPKRKPHQEQPTYEVECLSYLKGIL